MGFYPKTAIGSGSGGSGKSSTSTGAPSTTTSAKTSSGGSGGGGGSSPSSSSSPPPAYESPLAKNIRETSEKQAQRERLVSELRKSGYTGTRAEIAAQQISEGRAPIQATVQEQQAYSTYTQRQTQRVQDVQTKEDQQTYESNVHLVQSATGATGKQASAYVRTLPAGTVLVADRQKIEQARQERMTPTPTSKPSQPSKEQAVTTFQQDFRRTAEILPGFNLLNSRGIMSIPSGLPLMSNRELLPAPSDRINTLLYRGERAGGLVGVGSYFAKTARDDPFKLISQASTVYTIASGYGVARAGIGALAKSSALKNTIRQLPKFGKRGMVRLLPSVASKVPKAITPTIQKSPSLAAPIIKSTTPSSAKEIASRIAGSITTKIIPLTGKELAKTTALGIGASELSRQYSKATTEESARVGLTKGVRSAGFSAEVQEIQKMPLYKKIPYGFSVLTINDKAYKEGVKKELVHQGISGSQLTQAVEASARERKITGRALLVPSVYTEYRANELGEYFISEFFKRNIGRETKGAIKTGFRLFGEVGIRTAPAGIMEGTSQDITSRYQTSSELLTKGALKSYGESALLGGVFSSVAGGGIAGLRPSSNILSKSVLAGSYLGDFPGEPLGDLASYARRGFLKAAKNAPEPEPTILKRTFGKTKTFTLGLSQGGKVIAPASFVSPALTPAISKAPATSKRQPGRVFIPFSTPPSRPIPADTPPNKPLPSYTPESILNPSQAIPPEVPPQVPPEIPPMVPVFSPIPLLSSAVGLDRAFLPPLVPLPGFGGGSKRYGKESRKYVNELGESLKVLKRALGRRK